MSTGRARVEQALATAGGPVRIRTFTTAVPTAAAAAEQLGCETGAIANSLVFRVGDDVVLVLASGAHRVDTGRVAALLGVGKSRIRRADPDRMFAATGQHVGGVAPVGHPRALRTFVDRDLTRYDTVWAGAGDEHSMFATTAAELLRLTSGTLVDVGQEPDAPT